MSTLSINPSGPDTFRYKTFQLEDYARAALHDSHILAHDTGAGKTIALYTWPALKVGFKTEFAPGEPRGLQPLGPVLFVVPGDLHKQTIDEGHEKFKACVTPLDGKETFLRRSTIDARTGRRHLPPGYYLTSYTQLTGNGVKAFPAFNPVNVIGMMQILGLTDSDAGEYFDERESLCRKQYRMLEADPTMTLHQLRFACDQKLREYSNNLVMHAACQGALEQLEAFHCDVANPSFSDLPPAKKDLIRRRMTARVYEEYADSVGAARWLKPANGLPFKVKCVYDPSLSDLCQEVFDACCIDEGVKMKGEETTVGVGVRQIAARYRMVLTATPIKNRLPDVFRLAWWATGGRPDAHARFPYPDSTEARNDFAETFLVSERNLSREREKPGRFKKLTPQVCGVHRLWKMFAPIILRRRKADFGEDIVTKTRQIVRAPMGTEQARVYKTHLTGRYLDKNGAAAIGTQLQALRIASANPASELLVQPHVVTEPGAPFRAQHTYIPKLHSALKLIQQCLLAGEQVIVFSAFQDSLDVLAARLTEAGVTHCLVDGRQSPKRRGQLASQFKLGPGRSPFQVMLAGVECMAEGHSFPLCNNAILLCYSWAYDKFEQAINRVHRLNSRWPVKVYPIICERSIDRKLEAMIEEKSNAAELVLDGCLLGEQSDEVNLAELLEIARKEFAEGGTLITVDEAELEKEWPPLRGQLATASQNWRNKGLELVGFAPVPLLLPQPVTEPITTDSAITNSTRVFHGPANKALEIKAPDLSLFAGLPLFELAE